MNARAPITPSITPRWFARATLVASVLLPAGTVHVTLVAMHVLPPVFIGTASAAILFGASMGSIRTWRTGRGVWMLASFFALVATALGGTLAWRIGGELLQVMRRAPLIALDSVLSIALLAAAAILLAIAARSNWCLTRPRRRPPPSRPDAGARVPSPTRPDQPPLTAAARAPAPQ